jgi:hypothetical protein
MKTIQAILITALVMGCAQKETGVTDLDNALAAAQKDQSKANAFYNLFLNSDVLIPTRDTNLPRATPPLTLP